jgi:hypothetical protein
VLTWCCLTGIEFAVTGLAATVPLATDASEAAKRTTEQAERAVRTP